jgi:hypothetical protein
MSHTNSIEIQSPDTTDPPEETTGGLAIHLPIPERRAYRERAQAAVAAALAAIAIAGCASNEKSTARTDVVATETTVDVSDPTPEPIRTTSTTAPETTTTSVRPTVTMAPSAKAEKPARETLAAQDRQRLVGASGFEALSQETLHVVYDFTTSKGRRVVVVGVGDASPQVERSEIEQDFAIAEGVLDLGETVTAKDVWLGPGFQTSVEIIPRSSDLTPSRDPAKPVNDTSYIVVANTSLARLTSPVAISSLSNTTESRNDATLGLTVRNPYFADGGVTVSLVQNVSAGETIDNQPANASVMGTEVSHAVFGFDQAPRFERDVLDAKRPNMDYVLKGGTFADQKENLARLMGDAWANGLRFYTQEVRAGRQPALHDVAQHPMLADEFQDMGMMYIPPTPAQARLINQLVG